MYTGRAYRFESSFSSLRVVLLAFIWCFSLILGIFFSLARSEQARVLILSAATTRLAAANLIIVHLLLLLMCVIAAKFSFYSIFYLLIFAKGAAYGFCMGSAVLIFRNSGWLVFLLLTFSQTLLTVPQLWFCFSAFDAEKCFPKKEGMICVLLTFLLGSFDYFCISPLLECLVL